MTKRIFGGAFIVSLVAIISAVAMVLGVAYTKEQQLFKRQLEQQAMLLAATMENTSPDDDVESLRKLSHDIHGTFENRITYIGQDGTVLFDNEADPATMENHLGREEVVAAKQSGTGTAIRESYTMSEMTVYCARVIGYGCIVRVAGTMDTVAARIAGMWWEVLLIVIIAAMVSLGVAAIVARVVVKPINSIDLKNPDIGESYSEIAPLLHRISEQNHEIDQQIAELTRSRKEFSLITENMSEGFIIIDSRTEVLSYNTAALKILGSDFTGSSRSVLVLNRSEAFRSAVEDALAGKRSETDLTLSEKIYQVIATPAFTGSSVTGAVMIILDITEKEAREELRREFTSNVSHELKTPLTTIYGISDMLVGGIVKPEDIPGFAKNIRDEAGRMITLIQDILKLSQLDENTFSDQRERVDLYELAQSAAERLRPQADEKHVTISVTGERSEFTGIATVLEEMIYNLLDNAVKYNKQGGRADVDVRSSGDDIVVTVSDTGIGVPADSIDRIFERFYRADKSHSRKIGGTGLGLSIVKHGVSLHGGSITVKSSEGSGTTFTMALPKN
ncbi:MAG TPA: histidine kinase [Ruminococcaceae bacterium]|jgi:two-component system phosphate regulon sensor histidine kinase PhoR|nr:PAS domain S-box protein [Eubacterium sp.]HBM30444.1 histidine kinase [Oscillospiraceae bacterium]HCK49488.1 histidine kinase [Oscillospiraceae bacterium]